ncbi:alkaline phosphatase family protein [Rhodococcus sp. NPDC058505]|uniref:alkaline phosphatase family protein n=1 Tax=unclassified Rhodococcus (in: high G+C Gram-positive bacteria) TaxID=192944 RepID=UPI003657BEEA
MHPTHTHRTNPSGPSRRTVLAGAAALTGLTVLGTAPARATAAGRRAAAPDADVYVLVVDGMRPDELTPDRTPALTALAESGVRFPNASAITVAETLPNHAAMMTGVLPNRNGVPANTIHDRAEGGTRELDRPGDLLAPTMLDRVRAERGWVTASVLSKRYLHGLFGGRASVAWDPVPQIPGTEHAPDLFTTTALTQIVAEHSPRLTFVNLGDVDRVGHLDLSGPSLRLARTQSLRGTDELVRRFTAFLHESGRWDRSVLIVLADHSMDWSVPTRLVGLTAPLAADPLLRGRVRIAQNGGADLVYFTGGDDERAAAITRIRRIAAAVEGVESAWAVADTALGDRAGDVAVFCLPGWRFSDPTPMSNPIPGNHGHAATLPIPFFVAGGHRVVGPPRIDRIPVRTVDVAPTVAALFGMSAPAGGWDGAARIG